MSESNAEPSPDTVVPGLCSIAEAARLLGIGEQTARDLERRGEFPVEIIRLGRVRKVRRAELDAWMRGTAVGGGRS